MTNNSHMWKKDEIKKILELWNTMNVVELAKEFNVNKQQLGYIVIQMRKAGFTLPKKHMNGKLQSLLKEVLAETK